MAIEWKQLRCTGLWNMACSDWMEHVYKVVISVYACMIYGF